MSKTESFEFLNELALAFRAAENLPRPQYAPVLEGVRAVLAHLTAAGRLIPAGGMALTAEDVRKFIIAIERHYPEGEAELLARLRALFPATEPAEGPRELICPCRGRFGFHDCNTVSTPAEPAEATINSTLSVPAPAEPAEEETKAEALQEKVADLESQVEEEIGNRDEMEERLTSLIYSLATVEEVGEWSSSNDLDVTFIDHIGGKIQQLEHAALAARGEGWYEGYEVGLEYGPIAASGEEYDGPINPYDVPVSSPVVPAPAETGPWQDISEAPKHLTLIDRVGDKWTHDGDNWVTPKTAILPVLYINRKYAPFVAAEEG